MKLPHRRQFLHRAAGAATLPAISRFSWAQAYQGGLVSRGYEGNHAGFPLRGMTTSISEVGGSRSSTPRLAFQLIGLAAAPTWQVMLTVPAAIQPCRDVNRAASIQRDHGVHRYGGNEYPEPRMLAAGSWV